MSKWSFFKALYEDYRRGSVFLANDNFFVLKRTKIVPLKDNQIYNHVNLNESSDIIETTYFLRCWTKPLSSLPPGTLGRHCPLTGSGSDTFYWDIIGFISFIPQIHGFNSLNLMTAFHLKSFMCLQFHVVVCVCHSKISRKMEIKWKFKGAKEQSPEGHRSRAPAAAERPRAWVDLGVYGCCSSLSWMC